MKHTTSEPSGHPQYEQLQKAILERIPIHEAFLVSAYGQLSAAERSELDNYIAFCRGDGIRLDALADAYATIVTDTLREQSHFIRFGRYRYSKYAEVANSVYHDPRYMARYMYGLALTSFLWPNHSAMRQFFLKTLPLDRSGRYLEIGPGHGYYFTLAVKGSSFTSFTGIDISQTSIDLTARILRHQAYGVDDRITLLCGDFLSTANLVGPFQAIVAGEVLEHVENPDLFLARISSLSDASSFIFLTTCINAPMVDHIYLFRSTEEIEDLARGAGLVAKARYLAPYVGKTAEECERDRMPVNVAYVFARAE